MAFAPAGPAGQLADVGVVAALAFLVGGVVVAADKAQDGKGARDPAADLAESPHAAAEGGAELGEGGLVQTREIGVGQEDGLGAAVAFEEVGAGEGGAGLDLLVHSNTSFVHIGEVINTCLKTTGSYTWFANNEAIFLLSMER